MKQADIDSKKRRHGPMPIMMHLALMGLSHDNMQDILRGLHNYHHHSYKRENELANLPIDWQAGEVKLLKAVSKQHSANARSPILLIPSFINGSEILDLTQERSFTRWLSGQGHDVYLLDWGNLTQDQDGTTLSSLIQTKLIPALSYLSQKHDSKINLLGYCLGGLFALALAARCQAQINKTILLATPWDFHSPDMKLRPLMKEAKKTVKTFAAKGGEITAAFLQSLFVQTDLKQSAKKYANFGRHDPHSNIAKHFVATEDWVNSGSPLPAKLIQECIEVFFEQNAPYKNQWSIDGQHIDISSIENDSLIIAPEHDNIVPYSSSSPLEKHLKNAQLCKVDSGHIGMLVGRKAKENCWTTIDQFISS